MAQDENHGIELQDMKKAPEKEADLAGKKIEPFEIDENEG